jgi:hypothetical protein
VHPRKKLYVIRNSRTNKYWLSTLGDDVWSDDITAANKRETMEDIEYAINYSINYSESYPDCYRTDILIVETIYE